MVLDGEALGGVVVRSGKSPSGWRRVATISIMGLNSPEDQGRCTTRLTTERGRKGMSTFDVAASPNGEAIAGHKKKTEEVRIRRCCLSFLRWRLNIVVAGSEWRLLWSHSCSWVN